MDTKEYTAKKAVGILKQIRVLAKTDVKKQRIAYDEFFGVPMLSNNVDVREITITGTSAPDVVCDIFNPEVIFHNAVILYFHGGCFTAGSRLASRNLCCSLCHESGARVVCPEYRLAPEHPFPAALEDAYTVYRHLCKTSGNNANIILAGTDAGAAIAAALILKLQEQNSPMPNAAVFFSPWLDLSCVGETFAEERKHDPVLTLDGLNHCAELYTYKKNITNPLVSPMGSTINRFPPLLIQCGQHEILRSDATRFAQKAEAAGVSVDLQIYPDMWHSFQASDNLTSWALRALGSVGAFIRKTAKD